MTKTIDFGTFDLSEQAANGIDVTLIDETNKRPFKGLDDQEIIITIQGRDSDKWQDTAKKIDERNASKYKRRGVPSEVTESDLREILAAVTIKWSDNIPFGGEALECTYENCIKLYGMKNSIAEQLITAGVNRDSLKKS